MTTMNYSSDDDTREQLKEYNSDAEEDNTHKANLS